MRQPFSTLVLATILIGAAACTETNSDGASAAIKVRSTADVCEVAATEAPSGNLVFEVTNDGSEVTEFYILADDGRIVGEVENIGPGITRNLSVEAAAGNYFTVCKPGMVGDGIRAAFTVTG